MRAAGGWVRSWLSFPIWSLVTMAEAKYLRLDAADVAIIVRVFNNSRISWWPEEEHAQVKSLVRALGRYHVATAEELNEDFAELSCRGRPRKAKVQAGITTLPDDFESAHAVLRGGR